MLGGKYCEAPGECAMAVCYIVAGISIGVVLMHNILELHYFMRMALCVFVARFFKKRVHILEATAVQGICLSTDVDTLLYHMNNVRYLREIDFARVDFYERTKLYKTIRAKGGAIVQGGCSIRYRRFIRPFSMYKITSKIIYWDDKCIFMEHRFISPKDDFVRAIALCKQRLIDVSAEDIMTEMLALQRGKEGVEAGITSTKPHCPLEVQKWNESNEISSANLRNGC